MGIYWEQVYIDDLIKITEYLDNVSLLIDGTGKTVKNEIREKWLIE